MLRYSRIAVALMLVVCVLGLSSCTMWGEKKTSTWKSVTSGEQLTRLFWQSVKDKNWNDVQDHIAATAVGMSAQGTYNREQIMEHLKAMEITDFQIGEVRTEPAGTDLIVTYTLSIRGTAGGHPLPPSVRMMSVWQHVKSGHLLVAHSAVPAA